MRHATSREATLPQIKPSIIIGLAGAGPLFTPEILRVSKPAFAATLSGKNQGCSD